MTFTPLSRLDDLVGHGLHVPLHLVIVKVAADEALDGKERVFRISDGLAFGQEADQAFARLGNGDHRRGRAVPFLVFNNSRAAAFDDSHGRVGRAEIDS